MPIPYPRRSASGLLIAAALVAVGTPFYIAYVSPTSAGYVLHLPLQLEQLVPYVLCAALWLPWRSPAARNAGAVVSALVLVATVVIHAPLVWRAGRWGSDMMGLAFVATAAATTAVVLVASGAAAVTLWLRLRATSRTAR